LKNKITSATLLATGDKLEVSSGAGGLTVSLPAEAPDQISSTILLQLNGAPEIE